MKNSNSDLKRALSALKVLRPIRVSAKYQKQALPEYPFDGLALSRSALYRKSRKLFTEMGGRFSPRVSSCARSLSDEDLFNLEISYSPIETELLWFGDVGRFEILDAEASIRALLDLNGISIFHEQNHRIIWDLLPPPPEELADFLRYLNFAESLVLMLDIALADEFGLRVSTALEELKTIYRPSHNDGWCLKPKKQYRSYLCATALASYVLLEGFRPKDLNKALQVLFPKNMAMVKAAAKRSEDLNPRFVNFTNRAWQQRHWSFAQRTLSRLKRDHPEGPFCPQENPLLLGQNEFEVIYSVLDKLEL